MNPIYTPTEREHALAVDWHGGQASMLYAIASTGALTRGPIRPAGCETTEDHDADLAWRLWRELCEVVAIADNEGSPDLDTLTEWKAKADRLADTLLEVADA